MVICLHHIVFVEWEMLIYGILSRVVLIFCIGV